MTLDLNQEAELMEALNTINDGSLRGWDKDFITGIRADYEDIGSEMYVSQKMWAQIERIKQSQ